MPIGIGTLTHTYASTHAQTYVCHITTHKMLILYIKLTPPTCISLAYVLRKGRTIWTEFNIRFCFLLRTSEITELYIYFITSANICILFYFIFRQQSFVHKQHVHISIYVFNNYVTHHFALTPGVLSWGILPSSPNKQNSN